MDIETLRRFLAWCLTLDLAFLIFWWVLFSFGKTWIYGMHGKWFKISPETFDTIHYSGMAGFKILIFVFNLVPYLALRLFW